MSRSQKSPTHPHCRSRLALAILCAAGLSIPGVPFAQTNPSTETPQDITHAALQASDTTFPAYRPQSHEVSKSPNDKASYRSLQLNNGLKILLVHDPRADRAAASMNVAVGSAFDPQDMPGLAHFLEHMLFLGTDRYPKATEYENFLGKHGGSSNAYTALRNTNFYFEIPPQYFSDALDRFARFFVAPQFNKEYVNDERHAVDSEYHVGISNDGERYWEALGRALNPQHPFAHFTVGSLDTLKDGKEPLHQRLIDFYRQHYSANVMQLTLVGPETLDQLESLVRSRFSQVPNRHLDRQRISVPIILPDQLPKSIDIKTLNDTRVLTFYFPVPDPALYPRQSPDNYLANLIGDEGKGSILAALKHAGWANELSAGVSNADGQNAMFGVSINLTPKGVDHKDDIQATLFDYIQRIKQTAPQQWRYAEQSKLLTQQFNFAQVGSGADRASQLSASMALLPISEVNVAAYRMDDFDPGLIERYLDALTPKTLLRVYASSQVNGKATTQWYNTPYTLEKISQWPKGNALTGLGLPSPNTFIARNFTLDKAQAFRPVRIINTPGMDLWYQGNDSFGTPSAEWRINLMSPQAGKDPRQMVLTRLLADWLNESLSEELYPASLAGQNTTAQASGRGIMLGLSGWRDKQPQVLEALVKQLHEGEIDAASYERIRQQYEDALRNMYQQPLYQSLLQSVPDHLERPSVSDAQVRDVLKHITLNDLRQFRDQWVRNLHIQAMAIGNLSTEDAKQAANRLIQQLNPNQSLDTIPMPQALRLATALPTFRPTNKSTDSGSLVYRQANNDSLQAQAGWALLSQILGSPFYSELRTQQQLGYIVFAGYQPMKSVPGILMLIQSPKYPSKLLATRMNEFLSQFTSTIEALDDQDLVTYKQAVAEKLTQRPQNLQELTSKQWLQLSNNYLNFDKPQQLKKALDALTADDVKAAWKDVLSAHTFTAAADKDIKPNDQNYDAHYTLSPFKQEK